jgi:hypothetical protein
VDDQTQSTQLPVLKEHNFQSRIPVIGPLIQVVRRGVYGLAAKWAIRSLINQQNEINRLIAQRLQEYEERLIDQDRDLAQIARTLAEAEICQKYLMKQIPCESDDNDCTADAK